VEAAIAELKILLDEANAYETFYQQLVEPLVQDSFGGSISLPYGVFLSGEEVTEALREVTPPDWFQIQAEQIMDDATPYIIGEAGGFITKISLIDNKRAAVSVVEQRATNKLNERLSALPECSRTTSLNDILVSSLSGNIACIPGTSTVDQMSGFLGSEIAKAVERNILEQIPDVIDFSEVDLKDTLELTGIEDGDGSIEEVRTRVREGWIYTDVDLRDDIRMLFPSTDSGESAVNSFDQFRRVMNEGWNYTHVSLREDIVQNSDENSLNDLDSARDNLKRIRILGLLIIIPILILVAGIGFLGGDTWRSRAIWASAAVVVTAGLVLIIVGLVLGPIGESRLDDLRVSVSAGFSDSEAFVATKRLAVDKAFEILSTSISDLASGIAKKSLIVLALGLIGLGVSTGWNYIEPYSRRLNLPARFRR